MKFISAGHCATPGPNQDPGAIGAGGRWEAKETVKVRDRVVAIVKSDGATDIIEDFDSESLSQYLKRIKTGNGSMVCEFHFNEGPVNVSGTETIVGMEASKETISCAQELSAATSAILGIVKRGDQGVINESQSHHNRLGLMREQGIVVLVEVCFITNQQDMRSFDANFEKLCQAYAGILIKYDALIA